MFQRILLLADAASTRTQKWAAALTGRGYSVAIFSLGKKTELPSALYFNSIAHYTTGSSLLALPDLLKAIALFKPDVLHAGNAYGYALLGNLSRFRPFIISVTPAYAQSSFLKKCLLAGNCSLATQTLVNSPITKKELGRLLPRSVQVLPGHEASEAYLVQLDSIYNFALHKKQQLNLHYQSDM